MDKLIGNSAQSQTINKCSLRILVGEDNELNRKLMELFLLRIGYTAVFATNGEEVMDKLAQKSYDVVFLDLEMPLKSGFEVMKDISNFEIKPYIVVVTAHTAQEILEKSKNEGANYILSKPYSMTELQNVLKLCEKNQQAFLAN